jgi:hypothetical protein
MGWTDIFSASSGTDADASEPPMDEAAFWERLEALGEDPTPTQFGAIAVTIASGPEPGRTAHAFRERLRELAARVPPRALEIVADETGGLADDQWEAIRHWAVSCGREAFRALLEDPETMIRMLGAADLHDALSIGEVLSAVIVDVSERTGELYVPGAAA